MRSSGSHRVVVLALMDAAIVASVRGSLVARLDRQIRLLQLHCECSPGLRARPCPIMELPRSFTGATLIPLSPTLDYLRVLSVHRAEILESAAPGAVPSSNPARSGYPLLRDIDRDSAAVAPYHHL